MSAIIPILKIPRKIRSRRQYVLWTKRARDALIKFHGYRADSFIRIGDSEPSINYCDFYPWHWQQKWRLGGGASDWSGWIEKFPRGAVVHWIDGVDYASEAYDPHCPISLLDECQKWENYKFTETECEVQG
ncbi:hypothetical protein GN325_20795 [Agrobacterium vitis]|uniref:hypothetical protein n=1 Tax=Agrobacterium vitis TaxID=373 RepID=UPI0012E91AF7|nr:hypothetical protein [Agrobacterium vitis]MVB04206.1 hypothetical protein [Agrobacterium vitis]